MGLQGIEQAEVGRGQNGGDVENQAPAPNRVLPRGRQRPRAVTSEDRSSDQWVGVGPVPLGNGTEQNGQWREKMFGQEMHRYLATAVQALDMLPGLPSLAHQVEHLADFHRPCRADACLCLSHNALKPGRSLRASAEAVPADEHGVGELRCL